MKKRKTFSKFDVDFKRGFTKNCEERTVVFCKGKLYLATRRHITTNYSRVNYNIFKRMATEYYSINGKGKYISLLEFDEKEFCILVNCKTGKKEKVHKSNITHWVNPVGITRLVNRKI